MKRNFFLSALFACVSFTVLAQAPATTPVAKKGTAPTAVTCNDDPLNPIVGREYTYTATGTPAGGKFHFLATNATTFMTNGNLVTTGVYTTGNELVSAGATYNSDSNTTNNVKLAWSNTAQTPSFLVAHYTNSTAANVCANDNIKVWKITPKNAFTIEFRNIDKSKTTDDITKNNVDVCFGEVKSASYDAATDKIVYDYGEQKLYYELIVANYDKTFKPTLKLEGLETGQSATLKWGVEKTAITNAITGTNNEFSLPKITADTTAKPEEGVSIYVEVTIANGKFEGIADQTITLKADATTGANDTIKDVKFADCTERDAFDAKITQTLKARPAVVQNATGDFIAAQP